MEAFVQCPNCRTSYRIAPEQLPRANVRLRCARCKHVFPFTRGGVTREEAKAESESARRVRRSEEQPPGDMGTEVPRKTPAAGTPQAADAGVQVPDNEQNKPRPGKSSGGRPRSKEEEPKDKSFGVQLQLDDDDFVLTEPEEPRYLPDWDDLPPEPRPRSDDRAPFRTLIVLVGAITAFYGLFAASLIARPEEAQALMSKIPLVGQGVGEERLWARRVRLEGVEATVQQTKDGRPALVISGLALNTATSPLQAVQLSAEIFDPTGRVLDQKSVFLGNAVSARVLRDLTPQEISILQQVAPPKQFIVPPGKTASFAIVFFLDPGKSGGPRKDENNRHPSEFRLRVVAARRQG
ncbi:MAG: hypothetical protein KatS3mg077_1742 [Candidatus Binatia bacterium]|nr:MAG: hypothetical protein KatS3mg077_1742 [Candidatus Binatia bacterium]